ncbi:MAG: single-stranded DNA-binding protein [Quinella sp. 2Q5]|nr:single-stranded DNA-binding protein [Quinella sp. 2Q5]
MNKVFLSGNMTRDPEVRYSQSGKAFAKMGIAVNRPYSKEKTVDFFNLTAFNKTAEFCGRYMTKGTRVLVEGTLQTSTYENKDGVKVNSVDILVDNIEFAGGKRDDGGGRDSYSKPRESEPYAKRESSPKRDDYDFGGEPIDPDETPF